MVLKLILAVLVLMLGVQLKMAYSLGKIAGSFEQADNRIGRLERYMVPNDFARPHRHTLHR